MTKLAYNEMSERTCAKCGKAIKQRLIEKKNPNLLCFKHWKEKEALRNHFIDTNQRRKRVEARLPVKATLNPPANIMEV
jgi:hypothetical protein